MGASLSCLSLSTRQITSDQSIDISPPHAIQDQSFNDNLGGMQLLNRPPQLARDSQQTHINSCTKIKQTSSSQIGYDRGMGEPSTSFQRSAPPASMPLPWTIQEEQKAFSRSSKNGPRRFRMPRSSPSLRPGEPQSITPSRTSLSRRRTESNAVGLDRVIGSLQGIDRMIAQTEMVRSSSQRLSALMRKSCGELELELERPSLVPVNS